MKKQIRFEDFPVTLPVDVAWGEMDALRHVNNVIFFRYFENARIAYFEKAGISLDHVSGVGPILASISCKFIRPVYFPSKLLVGSRVYERTEKELRMNYGLFSGDGKTCFAVGDSVVAAFNYNEKKRADIPITWN